METASIEKNADAKAVVKVIGFAQTSEGQMTQTQLLNELRQLSLQQQLEVIQAAMRLWAENFQMIESRVNGTKGHKSLAEAANLLLADYREDAELMSFTALDGEPLYAEG